MVFDDLFEIDKNKKLLKCKFNNSTTPIYLIIRAYLFKKIIQNKFELETNIPPSKLPRASIFKYIFIALFKNIFFAPKKSIYIFSEEVLFIKKGNRYEYRLLDFLNELYSKDAQLITNSGNRIFKTPKKQNVFNLNLINDLSIIFGFFTRLKRKDKITIELFMDLLRSDKNVLLTEKQYEELHLVLVKIAKRKGFLKGAYNLFFKLKSPKLLILEDAHYLGEKAFILEHAKANGVITAELQHGYIGKSHYAYNFDESLNPILKKVLPDFFLSFGSYWNKQIRTPAKKVVIGNSNIIENVNQLILSKINQDKLNILIISAATNTKGIMSLCRALLTSELALMYNFTIRPHPSEKHNFEVRYKSILEEGVILDNNENLYQTLKDASIVVSLDFTTVLYESVFFTKKIFLQKTDFSNFYESDPIFISFNDNQDLLRLIMEEQEIEIEPNEIWDTNSHSNFSSFLTQI